jgi:PAS domain S-box-containing protein
VKLTTKVILFLLVLGLISGSLIIGLTWKVVRSTQEKTLMDVGLEKATDLAEVTSQGFELKSESILLPLLQAGQKASIDADYVAALDNEGRVLAHTNVAEKDKVYDDPFTQEILHQDKPGARVLHDGKTWVMEIWAPVWLKRNDESNEQFLLGGQMASSSMHRLGTIRLGMPLRKTLFTVTRITHQMSLIVAVIGLITFILTLALMHKLLIPIQLLAEGTSRIAQGQYGIEVPVTSHDELGDLVGSFNRMSQVLSETTVSKDFLGDILSHMIDPLIVMAMTGTIQMVNQATLDLLGYSKEELEGQPAHILFMSRQQSLSGAEQETLVMKGSVRNLELEFLKKSGEKVSVLFSSSVMKNLENQPTGVIAVAKDVTERKRLESIIRQSDKMSAVGQLAAGVAHEINNPLGVILGFAQAALRRITPGETLEMPLKSIEKEAVRCKDLVQDLLTFSRVSKVEREPMDLNKTIEGALSLVTARARTVQVEVRKELAADLPRLLGNPNQIQQVVLNLANNAFDAMGEQGGILTVKTESLMENPLSWICLRVTDTGSGIAPEVLPRVFEPFFTTKPVGKGTGLGLSLIHEMVKKHSGTIDVKSRPGNTEFCIKFPVRMAQGSAAHATS